ncbi:MAG: endonuclease IV [Clostridiales bacterium]|nr:endonuclease IV [Clostridiales bacterium]
MIRFGPSGNSESFYNEGYKSTWQAAKWIAGMGLSAYEYPFGRGVNMTESGAAQIREEMEKYGISVSAHAPYFINLANPDAEKREGSFRYITDTARALRWLGGTRMVVHTGAQMKMERGEALKNCREGLAEAYRRLEDAGFSDTRICIETMGKHSQIGDLEEIMELCGTDERLIPCVDFAHLHALEGGCLNSTEDFAKVLDTMERTIGKDRAASMHVHFSTIEYTAAGEKRHRTFAEKEYGPRFEHLAPLLKERDYQPVIICECKGTMAEDAAEMKRIWNGL